MINKLGWINNPPPNFYFLFPHYMSTYPLTAQSTLGKVIHISKTHYGWYREDSHSYPKRLAKSLGSFLGYVTLREYSALNYSTTTFSYQSRYYVEDGDYYRPYTKSQTGTIVFTKNTIHLGGNTYNYEDVYTTASNLIRISLGNAVYNSFSNSNDLRVLIGGRIYIANTTITDDYNIPASDLNYFVAKSSIFYDIYENLVNEAFGMLTTQASVRYYYNGEPRMSYSTATFYSSYFSPTYNWQGATYLFPSGTTTNPYPEAYFKNLGSMTTYAAQAMFFDLIFQLTQHTSTYNWTSIFTSGVGTSTYNIVTSSYRENNIK